MSDKSKQSPKDLERRLCNISMILRDRDAEIAKLRQELNEKRSRHSARKSRSMRLRGSMGLFSSDKNQSAQSDDSTAGRKTRQDSLGPLDISTQSQGSEDSAIEAGHSSRFGRRMSKFGTSHRSDDSTKSSKKPFRPSVGILDKTVDIGQKACNIVLKSTVHAKMKTGRFFGFKAERRKRLSSVKAKNALTKWDNAVETIDQLLEDDHNGLDSDEKTGLRDIQELLLRGMENEVEKTYHIPINLLEGGSQRLSLNAKTFVLNEYGGITQRKPRPALLRQAGIRDSARVTLTIGEDWDDSIPSEFSNLSQEQKCKIYEMLKWNNLKKWDFDIFELDEVSEGHPLVLMGWAVLGAPHAQRAMAKACDLLDLSDESEFLMGYNFVESEMKIPLQELGLYLRLVEDNYRQENRYHNAIHAADVVQTLNLLIQMGGDEMKFNDEALFSILLAAVVHDVDHPGLNNSYQVTARTNLSLQYNDISVLENYHASKAFTMMIKSSPYGDDLTEGTQSESVNLNAESDFDVLCNTDAEQFSSIKGKTIDAILHTDMKLHFQTVSKIKGLIMSEEKPGELEAPWDILTFMLHMADISNAGKPEHISQQWTDRCLDEFFAQGDQEKKLGMEPSPQCDRDAVSKPESQIGFIQFVVQPAYEVLACIIPEVKNVVIPQLEENRRYWEAEAMRTDEEDSIIPPDNEHEYSITDSTDDFSLEEKPLEIPK